MFEFVESNVSGATAATSVGFHAQPHYAPFVVAYGLDDPKRTRTWESARFKAQRIRFEKVVGPAGVVFARPQDGWAVFQVSPAKADARALFAGGQGYSFDGAPSGWALVGAVTFAPGTALDTVLRQVRTTIDHDLKLYGKDIPR